MGSMNCEKIKLHKLKFNHKDIMLKLFSISRPSDSKKTKKFCQSLFSLTDRVQFRKRRHTNQQIYLSIVEKTSDEIVVFFSITKNFQTNNGNKQTIHIGQSLKISNATKYKLTSKSFAIFFLISSSTMSRSYTTELNIKNHIFYDIIKEVFSPGLIYLKLQNLNKGSEKFKAFHEKIITSIKSPHRKLALIDLFKRKFVLSLDLHEESLTDLRVQTILYSIPRGKFQMLTEETKLVKKMSLRYVNKCREAHCDLVIQADKNSSFKKIEILRNFGYLEIQKRPRCHCLKNDLPLKLFYKKILDESVMYTCFALEENFSINSVRNLRCMKIEMIKIHVNTYEILENRSFCKKIAKHITKNSTLWRSYFINNNKWLYRWEMQNYFSLKRLLLCQIIVQIISLV